MTNYRRRKPKPKVLSKVYITNERIVADELRVINEAGDMLGIMTRQEALDLADEQEKDIIEINPKGNPPVVKLIQISKFKYQLDKAEKAKPKVNTDAKNLRVSVRISPNDLAVQARKADEFLKKGLKVKLQVQMRGREKSHPELSMETMLQFLGFVVTPHIIESPAKITGDSCFAQLKAK